MVTEVGYNITLTPIFKTNFNMTNKYLNYYPTFNSNSTSLEVLISLDVVEVY